MAIEILTLYSNSNFMEVREMATRKKAKKLYCEAIQYCIHKKRDIVAFQLIAFSREMAFQLSIQEKQMDELINNKASGIIERLVNSNAIYLTDERNLDQEELMQVEILRMKELEKEKKKAEIQ